jgi:predicted phage tail protein
MATAIISGIIATAGAVIAAGGYAAFTAAGFTLFSTFATFTALAAVSQALAPKPRLGTQLSGQAVMTREPAQSRKLVYGKTRVGGNVVYLESSGTDNKYIYLVMTVASHQIESYEEVYFNDQKIWENGSYVDIPSDDDNSLDWGSFASISFYDGTQTTADSGLVSASNKWTADHKLLGVAYMVVRLTYDQEQFAQGLPNVSAVIKGKPVYNPSTDVTEWTDNTALCVYDYLRDSQGLGASVSEILTSSVTDAASVCDESVTLADASTQARYTLNGVVDTANTIQDNLEQMLTSMIGRITYVGGKFELYAGEYVAPTITIDESMITGEINVQTKQSRRSMYNGVKGVFLSAEDNYILADYPAQISSTFEADDGDPRYLDMTLPFTTHHARAQRIAKLALLASRQQEAINFTCNLNALKFKVGEIIYVTNERLGYNQKEFEVIDYRMSFAPNGGMGVSVQAIETAANIWDWTTSDEEVFLGAGEVDLYDGSASAAPTNLSVVGDSFVTADGVFNIAFDVSWDSVDDAFNDHYVVEWKLSGASTYYQLETKTSPATIVNLQSGQTYNIRVKAINELGRASPYANATPVVAVDAVAPSVPTAMSVTGSFKTITVSWTVPSEKDFSHVEIKRSNDSTEGNAVYIDRSSGESYSDSGYTAEVTRYYWLRSVDRTGNASAWVLAGNATSTLIQPADLADGSVDLDILSSSLQGTIAAKAEQTDVDQIIDEVQDTGNTLDTIAERMLTLATTQNETLGTISDAGITVDPSTGAVTIQAVEGLRSTLESQINTVSVDLDAAEAEIALKASTTYVNNSIAAAVLDSADLASLNALEAQIDQAEIDIDGNTAAIALKADSTTVSGINVRLTTAEADIDGAEAAIALKASSTDLSALDTRVGSAEVTLNALDVPSITQTIIDSRTLKQELDDSAITTLQGLMNAYKNQEEIRTDLAFAQSGMSAHVNELRQATAQDKTELVALIDDNKASILSESTARADADAALTTTVNSLTATVNANSASITTEQAARADGDSALAADITSLTATVGENSATITSNQEANVNSLGTLEARYGVALDVNGYVTGFVQNNDGNSGSFVITTDSFKVVDPAGGASQSGVEVFVYESNKVKFGTDVEVNAGVINVDDLAAISADLGSITAGSIDGVDVKIGSGSSVFKADTNGIYLGDETFASAEFRVTPEGALTATSATISGDITANNLNVTNATVTGTFDANNLPDLQDINGEVDTDNIADNAIENDQVAPNAITATEINVDNLAAINADLGAVTAGTINNTTNTPTAGQAPTGSQSGTAIDLAAGSFTFGNVASFLYFNTTDGLVQGGLTPFNDTVSIYYQGSSAPSSPSDSSMTYTNTGAFSFTTNPPTGWTLGIPNTTDNIYVVQADIGRIGAGTTTASWGAVSLLRAATVTETSLETSPASISFTYASASATSPNSYSSGYTVTASGGYTHSVGINASPESGTWASLGASSITVTETSGDTGQFTISSITYQTSPVMKTWSWTITHTISGATVSQSTNSINPSIL